MKNGLVEYLRSEDPILSIRLLYKPSCRELLATEVKEIIQHKRNNIQTEINNDEKKSAKLLLNLWIFKKLNESMPAVIMQINSDKSYDGLLAYGTQSN